MGSLAEIEITRAEAQVYSGQQDLVVSQTNLLQQETILKNALVRDGITRANIANVRLVPLDQIEIPASDNLQTVDQLTEQALGKRVEVQTDKVNIESNQMNLVGIKNSLKPSLQAFAETNDQQRAGRTSHHGGRGGAGVRRRIRQLPVADLRAALSELLGGRFAERHPAESRRAGGLHHQPTGASPE